MSRNLNSLKGVIQGVLQGSFSAHARSLDYGSCMASKELYSECIQGNFLQRHFLKSRDSLASISA